VKAATLIPVEEYLAHTYHPDCEYVEGQLVERNVGEIGHSDTQSGLVAYVRYRCPGFWAGVEARVQVKPDRFRVPDVSIVRGGKPKDRYFVHPPAVVVEVLSPEDRALELIDKIGEYLAFGVECVWVLDPESQRAYVHTAQGSHEVTGGVLRNPAGDLQIPLTAVFTE
jgi:Uma2 family endonuclease